MKTFLKGNKRLLLATITFSLLANIALVLTSKQYEWFFDVVASGDVSEFTRLVVFAICYIAVIAILFYIYLVCSKKLIKRILV